MVRSQGRVPEHGVREGTGEGHQIPPSTLLLCPLRVGNRRACEPGVGALL
jgi:hypothetical protein